MPAASRALPAWRFGLDGAPAAQAAGGGAALAPPSEPPATGADFERAWRRADATQRRAYLRLVSPDRFEQLFRVRDSERYAGPARTRAWQRLC